MYRLSLIQRGLRPKSCPLGRRSFQRSSFLANQEEQGGNDELSSSSGQTRTKASQLFNNLLHGNKAVQAQVEEAHSKLLARGQTVTEISFHRIKPHAVEEYLHECKKLYRPLLHVPQTTHYGNFLVEIGLQDMAVHITTFESYAVYEQWRTQWDRGQERQLAKTLRSRTSHICREFSFWDSVVIDQPGIYELRSYGLKPGTLLEWGSQWRKGVEARRQFCHPISAWFTQLGELNTVHHLWYYDDLASRRIAREKAWQVKGWSETVFQTVPLVTTITSNVMRRIQLQD